MEKRKQLIFLEDSKGIVKTKNKNGHLYVLSDDEIKEGNLFYNIHSKIVGRAAFNFGKDELAKKVIATTDTSLYIHQKETVSLPERVFYLPQPSQQFIEKYIEEYNKGNIITDVLVEYEEWCNCNGSIKMRKHLRTTKCDKCIEWEELKINYNDNTITIKKIKNSYSREEVDRLLDEQTSKTTAEMLEKFKGYKSREEVIKLCKKAFEDGEYTRKMTSLGFKDDKYYNYNTEDWIKENL